MPLTYSDVTQLSSLALAVSAIGIGIDGVMVPRLEKFRDFILGRSAKVLDDESSKEALELALAETDDAGPLGKIKSSFDDLQTIRDDLAETFYFEELASWFFFGGSIVRLLIVAMLLNAITLILATSVEAGFFGTYCTASAATAVPTFCAMNAFAVLSMVTLAYIVVAFFTYIFFWHQKIKDLGVKRTKVQTTVGNLDINFKLIKSQQARTALAEASPQMATSEPKKSG